MKSKLNRQQISDLISIYQNSLEKLSFQVSKTQETINELEKMLRSTKPEPEVTLAQPSTTATAKTAKPKRRGRPKKSTKTTASAEGTPPKKKRGRGRPKKTTATAEAAPAPKKRGRGRPKKTAASASPKTTVAKTKSGKVAKKAASAPGYRLSDWDQFVMDQLQKGSKLKSDLVTAAENSKEKLDPKMSNKQIYVKISNVLHKLSNNKKLINKVDTEGRGYAYELAK